MGTAGPRPPPTTHPPVAGHRPGGVCQPRTAGFHRAGPSRRPRSGQRSGSLKLTFHLLHGRGLALSAGAAARTVAIASVTCTTGVATLTVISWRLPLFGER